METVTARRTFDSDLSAMVARCRTLDSRKLWPGAVLSYGRPDTLGYTLAMRLKKVGTMTDLEIEEKLGPVEEAQGAQEFKVAQRLTWPDGHADAQGHYRFVPGTPNTIEFTYLYEPPSTKLIKTKELPAFHSSMELVIGKYLERLTR